MSVRQRAATGRDGSFRQPVQGGADVFEQAGEYLGQVLEQFVVVKAGERSQMGGGFAGKVELAVVFVEQLENSWWKAGLVHMVLAEHGHDGSLVRLGGRYAVGNR